MLTITLWVCVAMILSLMVVGFMNDNYYISKPGKSHDRIELTINLTFLLSIVVIIFAGMAKLYLILSS